MMLVKEWLYPPAKPVDNASFHSLQESLGDDRWLAPVLWQRGLSSIEEVRRFFQGPALDFLFPWQLIDMDKAVDRLEMAFQRKEQITVFGDYDVDGTTSVAVVSTFLRSAGFSVVTYIPDRSTEGYGLGMPGVEAAVQAGSSVLIALDCGIKSHKEIAHAHQLGVDCIVCDHHTPDAQLPPAVAIINAKRPDDTHPFKDFSACGVGFLLCLALADRRKMPTENLWSLIDLVAISIGADMVPLVGLNRSLVLEGLRQMNRSPRPAVKALLANRKRSSIDLKDVVFAIAPRINAAGRMAHGHLAVELLTASTDEQVEVLRQAIESHNDKRRSTDQVIFGEAAKEAKQYLSSAGMVVHQPHWHKGVVGIVAQRLVESFYKPTVVLTTSKGVLAGSARSVEGFDLYAALEACSAHLLQFGGHRAAAGMTLLPEKLLDFRAAFDEYCEKTLTPDQRHPVQRVDALVSLRELTDRSAALLERMAPFGVGNEEVILGVTGIQLLWPKAVGPQGDHLKVVLHDCTDGTRLSGIGFRMGSWANTPLDALCRVAFTLEFNEFNGKRSLQAHIVDLQLQQ